MNLTKEQKAGFRRLHDSGHSWADILADFRNAVPTTAEIERFRKSVMRSGWKSRQNRQISVENREKSAKSDKNAPLDAEKCSKVTNLTQKELFEAVSGTENELEINKKVFLDPDLPKTPETILKAFGYDPVCWTVKRWHVGSWDSPNTEGTRVCYMVRATLSPKKPAEFTEKDYEELAKRAFSKIPAIKEPKTCGIGQKSAFSAKNGDWYRYGTLLEVPPVELHLGKMASETSEGQRYDLDVASGIFGRIFDEIVARQAMEHYAKALVVVGGDFFNSESTGTTTKGTPQNNVAGYHDVFIRGLQLYEDAIFRCSKAFPNVDVMLCPGNHDRAMDFFLYIALKKRFMCVPNVSFSENYRDTQAYRFGECAIFYNHGDANYKRTIASIPAEFGEVWGKTKFRELHMGHLHSEKVADENMGMIVRRVGAPCPPDGWHYVNRFIGAVRKHQTFAWSDSRGLTDIHYITVK